MPLPPKIPRDWPFLIVVALGLFAGTFWLFLGFLLLLGHTVLWWHYAVTLLPGIGVLFLVLMARRHPLPYGTGLIALGVMPLFMFHLSSAWRLRLEFGLPLIGIGLGLVLLRCFAGKTEQDAPHG